MRCLAGAKQAKQRPNASSPPTASPAARPRCCPFSHALSPSARRPIAPRPRPLLAPPRLISPHGLRPPVPPAPRPAAARPRCRRVRALVGGRQDVRRPPVSSAPLTVAHRFNIYIYDYCHKRGFKKTAKELLAEADIAPESTPPINARQGLLFESVLPL
jgi:hypothetical protein